MLKRKLKFTSFTILGFIAFIALSLLAAVLFSRWQVKKELALQYKDEKPFEIYILTNGVHTDIVVPVKNDFCDWSKVIPFSNTIAKDTNAKWLAFGWEVLEMDGNQMDEITATLKTAKTFLGKGKPICILMKTEMGKGVDFMEGSHEWHGIAPSDDQLAAALAQLPETLGDY